MRVARVWRAHLGLAVLFSVARTTLAADADLDPTFGDDGIVASSFTLRSSSCVAVQSDDKLLLPATRLGAQSVVRLNADGTTDTSFGVNGQAQAGTGWGLVAAQQTDGKVVVGGRRMSGATYQLLVSRFGADGVLDPLFNGGASIASSVANGALDLVIDTAGRIVVVGSTAIVRFLPDGTFDPVFGVGGVVPVDVDVDTHLSAVVLQPDGKIVVAGYASVVPSTNAYGFVARFSDSGSADGAFAVGGIARFDPSPTSSELFFDAALQPDGRLVVSGALSFRIGVVARYDTDGTLDATFGGGGYVTTDFLPGSTGETYYSVLVAPDGKIVATGLAGNQGEGRFRVTRFLDDGTLDASFGGGSTTIDVSPDDDFAYCVARQSDGKLVVSGVYGPITTNPIAVVRLGDACGSGARSASEECDDGNTIDGDCCSAACTAEAAGIPCSQESLCLENTCDGHGLCGTPAPAATCAQPIEPARAVLRVKDAANPAADQLAWKWSKGAATTLAELSDPTATTRYEVCGYDLSTPTPGLLFAIAAPPGGLCGGRPCWSANAKGFKYRDSTRSSGGLDAIKLASGVTGRAKASAKAKGPALRVPPLPLPLPALVQLRGSQGTCFEAAFSESGVRRNDAAVATLKSD